MKKTLKILALVLTFVITVAVFTACGTNVNIENRIMIFVDAEGAIEVVIRDDGEETTVMIAAGPQTVGQILDALAAQKEGFVFDTTGNANDRYGRMLNVLGNLNPGSGEFIGIYLSYHNEVYAFPSDVMVDDISFWFANFGIDQIPVFNGVTYLFVIQENTW